MFRFRRSFDEGNVQLFLGTPSSAEGAAWLKKTKQICIHQPGEQINIIFYFFVVSVPFGFALMGTSAHLSWWQMCCVTSCA